MHTIPPPNLVALGEGSLAIAPFPVTEVDYQRFVDESGHPPPPHWRDGRHPEPAGRHPVTNVTFLDAVAYCRWLGDQMGRMVRLPSGVEWVAAAGGDGRRFPWGDTFDPERCNTWESGWGSTTPVDTFPEGRSPLGVWDLAGNVWEWTTDPAPSPGWRLLRGGSWYDTGVGVSIARTLEADPARPSSNTGFRPVIDARPDAPEHEEVR